MNPLTHTERAKFFAAVHDIGHGDTVRDAAFRLAVEVVAQNPAPWAQAEPFAAERYLSGRGASPDAASRNAVEFEISMRTLYELATGTAPATFSDMVRWIETDLDGAE
ncbi:hypothetical protein EAO71_20390 [Streptomyces sp. ms191]|uniref:hypothetical protein n=1 Tax=Streptomyces sp. ms191 TaxID=1827978 RepID=UPI0011CE3320|nr:hypothetical protein [Streptomyces sp. ms191]TXS30755.1 hypothetical protein EAO71_20390 [Streptomyces sp. ms191]